MTLGRRNPVELAKPDRHRAENATSIAITITTRCTPHLDVEKERRINESLRRVNITRISAAHRPDAMSVSDSVVHLSGSVGAASSGKRQLMPGLGVRKGSNRDDQGSIALVGSSLESRLRSVVPE